jgi:CRP-like cAMP-binding protein
MKSGDLKQCPLCSSFNPLDEEAFLENIQCMFKTYPGNLQIINQGQLCDSLYILVTGSVKTEMITENGNILGIEIIQAPRPLAPAFLFSDNNKFPVNVITLEEVEIAKIPKEEVVKIMMTNPDFMQKYLTHNANRTQFLTNRLQLLSIKTIKGKLAYFLVDNAKHTNEPFFINRNQSQLAEYFGVTRPSLARSLSEMVHDGIIEIKKKQYKILDLNKLKELLI